MLDLQSKTNLGIPPKKGRKYQRVELKPYPRPLH